MTRRLALFLALLALAAMTPAHASAAPRGPAGKATITTCKDDRIAVAAAFARGPARAKLILQPQAVPLFGLLRKANPVNLGVKRSATVEIPFEGLTADTWTGIVSYRWVRGRRTVASGRLRTDSVRVGRKRGRAFCTLPVGRLPRDERAPAVAISPADDDWRRAPVGVTFSAFDDFSGVAEVVYSVNGGAPQSGRSLTLAEEGAHTIDYAARDAAGNWSAPGRQVVRVDGAPPSAPVIQTPAYSHTGDSTPEISFTPAVDTGSGVQGYYVVVRSAATGQVVSFQPLGPAQSSVSVASALPNGSYEALVVAIDGTRPEPQSSTSQPRAFEVLAGDPRVTSSVPADGAVLASSQQKQNLTVNFDRPMTNVGPATIVLTRNSGQEGSYTVECNSPCTQATIDPSYPLEGSFTLSVSGPTSEEGVPVTPYSASFRVRAYENDFSSCPAGFTPSAHWGCANGELTTSSPQRCLTSRTYSVASAPFDVGAGGPSLAMTYTYSFARPNSGDRARVRAYSGNQLVLSREYSLAGGGTVTDQISGASGSLRLEFEHFLAGGFSDCAPDPNAHFSIDNVSILRNQ